MNNNGNNGNNETIQEQLDVIATNIDFHGDLDLLKKALAGIYSGFPYEDILEDNACGYLTCAEREDGVYLVYDNFDDPEGEAVWVKICDPENNEEAEEINNNLGSMGEALKAAGLEDKQDATDPDDEFFTQASIDAGNEYFDEEDEATEEEQEDDEENEDEIKVLTVNNIEEVGDPVFEEFWKSVRFRFANKYPDTYLGNEHHAEWAFEGKKLSLVFFAELDPEEYSIYQVNVEHDDEENSVEVLGNFDTIEEAINCVKEYEKTLTKKATKTVAKVDRSESKEKNEFGHGIGTIYDTLDKLLMKGCTIDEVKEAGVKPTRFHVHCWTLKNKSDGKINVWKEGKKYFAALN